MDTLYQITELLVSTATDDFGEKISHLEHALQTYSYAKEHYPEDDELAVAGFWHDIGHSLYGSDGYDLMMSRDEVILGVHDHDKLAADILKDLLSKRCCALIENHTMVKRYKAYKGDSLSEASKETLELEGGLLTSSERLQFEKHPLFSTLIKLRECDDAGKSTSFDYQQRGGKEILLLRAISDTLKLHLDLQKIQSMMR